ncbi:MAG: dUTP diphosphatase [Fusobacterium sp.]|uniref:dUTP diphosphatase n=1 Tax=Fusobacterium sp. TaxID=68766 RepID=UPI003F9F8BF7
MEIKKPKIFRDILSLQKYLDDNINNIRPRYLRDIKMSLIAECVEFNEETKESHKTWKTKEYDKSKELEELTDIWFFVAQMINYCNDNENLSMLQIENLNKYFSNDFSEYIEPTNILNIIFYLKGERTDYDYFKFLIMELIVLTNQYGYKTYDILNCYWEKWQKNMKRIGKEWN